jgi:uncharacterized protein (TIGR03083 family)
VSAAVPTSVDHLAAVADDTAALAAAATSAGLDAPVAACPAWTMADLVRHVSRVHQWVEAIVRTRTAGPIDPKSLPAITPSVDALTSGSERLLSALRAADPDEPVWNWSTTKPHVAGFWRTRMAQETAVHRWDGEAAAGFGSPIDAALAVEGIDEFVDVFLPTFLARQTVGSSGGSLHLHATDTDGGGEWVVSFADGAVSVVREHAKGDAAARATASDLLLLLWNRLDTAAPGIQTFGDDAVFAAFRAFRI